ncbi:MAG: hemolysin III family protein [Erysipelothrix sp.]|nr:hemolysin III family protein [Erysipelothrix sp.]
MKNSKGKHALKALSLKEEIGNSTTHGIMAMLILFYIPFGSVLAYQSGGWILTVSIGIFYISLFFMFLMSTLYHAMHHNSTHKSVFQILDHIAIYVAIAGSYTPVALYLIGGSLGWVIFAIQWTMVLLGILYKSIARQSIPKLSVTIYLIMGWIVVLFLPTLIKKSNLIFLALIGLGGILYTIGAMFYMQKHRSYFHLIWHIFINFAALAHFVAISFYL